MSTLRNAMHIPTIDEFYEYRMKRIVNKLVEDYPEEFEALSPEEVQDKIWTDFSSEFGKLVLEDMVNYAGDELFGGVIDD